MALWRERLRDTVRRSGFNQATIASAAGISPETLGRILSGKTREPRIETLAAIAHSLATPVGWLLGERGYSLSAEQVRRLREVANVIREIAGE